MRERKREGKRFRCFIKGLLLLALFLLTSFSPTSVLAASYPTFTPNSDLVIVGPYDTATQGNTLWGEGANAYREFLTVGQKYRIRQNGTISRIKVCTDNITDMTGFYIKIWRKVGSNYNLVGTSNNLVSSLSATTCQTVDLSTPITGVQEGDYYGYRVEGNGGNAYHFKAQASMTNVVSYYLNALTPSDTDYNWEVQSQLPTILKIEFYMQAPQTVFIGNSIIAGHTGHYSFLETTATTNVASTMEKQFSTLTGYTYQNMGIGGQTTTNISSRFTTDAINLKPRLIVAEGGINDIIGSGAKQTFLNNWTSILNAAQANNIPVAVLKILPWTNGTNAQLQTKDDWNSALVTLAGSYSNVIIVDANTYVGQFRSGGDVGNVWDIKTGYSPDGIHYNQTGYGYIAQAIADILDGSTLTLTSVSSIPTSTGATIAWTSGKLASTKVDYGTTTSYGTSTSETDTTPRVTSHSVTLTGLSSCTTYHYRVRSIDGATNEVIGSDNTVTTTGCQNPSILGPSGYTKDNTKPTLSFIKPTGNRGGISTYTVTLDSGKNKSFSASGIPANGNGSSNYVWRDDSSVKIEFLNENDSDSSNDQINVYFKDLNSTELSEGKHTWTVTAYDPVSASYGHSADFYIDKTLPSLTELAIANVSSINFGQTYKLDSANRMPSFSGLAIDTYQGSTVTYSNGTKDTFDKIDSGPQTITLTFQRLEDGQDLNSNDAIYKEYLTKDYSLSDILDKKGENKSTRFYITTPFPLVDGFYKVAISLKDGAGNSCSNPSFYLSLNFKAPNRIQNLLTGNLQTEIINQETVPAITQEEKQQIQKNGYTVKVKVVDTHNKPVNGAKVTIHSKVQEAITNKNGIAQFSNVEPGAHKVLIAYSGYSGEQDVNLAGDVKEFSFNIQVKQQNTFLNPQVIAVVGILVVVIGLMAFLLIRAKRKEVN